MTRKVLVFSVFGSLLSFAATKFPNKLVYTPPFLPSPLYPMISSKNEQPLSPLTLLIFFNLDNNCDEK